MFQYSFDNDSEIQSEFYMESINDFNEDNKVLLNPNIKHDFEKTTEITETKNKIFDIKKTKKKRYKSELIKCSIEIEHFLPKSKINVEKIDKKIQTDFVYKN